MKNIKFRKMIRQILSTGMTVMMLVTYVPVTAFAADTDEISEETLSVNEAYEDEDAGNENAEDETDIADEITDTVSDDTVSEDAISEETVSDDNIPNEDTALTEAYDEVIESVTTTGNVRGFVSDENGTYYIKSDGNKAKGWLAIGRNTYYFNDQGYMVTDKLSVVTNDYYFDSDGVLKKGLWQDSNGDIYYSYPVKKGSTPAGCVAKNKELEIDGTYYYFSNSGKALRNAWGVQSYRYYDENGARVTGLYNIGGYYYYFNDEGIHVNSTFVEIVDDSGIPGTYYFNNNGRMVCGSSEDYEMVTIGGSKYVMDNTGRIMTGWIDLSIEGEDEIECITIYCLDSGKVASGPVFIEDDWYCFDDTGRYVRGEKFKSSEGKWYMTNNSGCAYTGWYAEPVKDEGGNVIGENMYYFDPETAEAASGLTVIDGKAYYFRSREGDIPALVTDSNVTEVSGFYADTNGELSAIENKPKLVTVDGKRYYLGSNGTYITGWVAIGSSFFYFDETTCTTVTGAVKIGSKTYYFNSNGLLNKTTNGTTVTIDGVEYKVRPDGSIVTGWTRDDNNDWSYNPDPAPVASNGCQPALGAGDSLGTPIVNLEDASSAPVNNCETNINLEDVIVVEETNVTEVIEEPPVLTAIPVDEFEVTDRTETVYQAVQSGGYEPVPETISEVTTVTAGEQAVTGNAPLNVTVDTVSHAEQPTGSTAVPVFLTMFAAIAITGMVVIKKKH